MTSDDLLSLIAKRIHQLPRFRKRLEWPQTRGMRPYWVDDEKFDLARHVIVEEPIGTDNPQALADLVARRFCEELDRDRPLWRVHWIPDRETQSAALLLKASHTLFDGMSGIEIARVLLDRHQKPPDSDRPEPWVAKPPPPQEEALATQWAEREIAKVRSQWIRAAGLIEIDPALERRIEFLDGWISALGRSNHGMPRFTGSRPQRLRFSFAFADQDTLRTAARQMDVTLDELLAAAAAGGVSRLLRAKGPIGQDERIRTMLPVALPRRGRRETLGNAASFVIVALPLGEMSAVERLRLTVSELREAREAGQQRTTARAIEIMEHLPIDVDTIAGAAASEEPLVDLVVSYVRGPRRQLYIAGYPHVATVPVLPIAPSMRLSIGFVALGAEIGIGISADASAVPEVDFLVDGVQRTSAELTVAAHQQRGS